MMMMIIMLKEGREEKKGKRRGMGVSGEGRQLLSLIASALQKLQPDFWWCRFLASVSCT